MAASSNHPVSQAVLQGLDRADPGGRVGAVGSTGSGTPFLEGLDVRETPGGGLECVHGGSTWRLGSRQFTGVPCDASDRRECVLVCDGELVALFELEEDFRSGAAAEIADLQRRGIEVHLLSGDRPERVRRAAEVLGVPAERAHGGLSPEDKASAIRELAPDEVMMVGDGLNDAPAFAEALCAGTPAMDRPVLPARADFCFRGATAGAVRSVFDVAELHARTVRTNLALALAYNATAVSLCFAAAMTPVLCAVLMPLSSAALVLHTAMRFARARRTAGRGNG
jgi:Cu2+-exporting ATPase